METKVTNYEQLSQYVDALIATKYPNQPEKILNSNRANLIKELNDYILAAVADGLTDKQVDALESILNNPDSDDVAVNAFFAGTGSDLNQRIEGAMTDFGKKYMEAKDE